MDLELVFNEESGVWEARPEPCVCERLKSALEFYENRDKYEEVVRCKDCINYNPKGCSDGFGWCEAWDQGRMDHNFCHCGERKENE